MTRQLESLESWAAHFSDIRNASDAVIRESMNDLGEWMGKHYAGEAVSLVAEETKRVMPPWTWGMISLEIRARTP